MNSGTDAHVYQLLLLDDDEVDVITFQRAIKKADLANQADICYNASEALIQLGTKTYDCIFLDYLLPGTDALQLLRKLREMNINTPIAVITSQGDEKIAVEMIKNGAFDYFAKNEIYPDKLSKVVFSAVRLWNAERQRQVAEKQILENNSRLNAVVNNPNIPIIALSADAFLETRRKVIEAGMNDYVIKPFKPEELCRKIVKYTQKISLLE